MRVEVYKNLHKGCYSIREAGGRVLAHANRVFIKDPEFVVQPAGRQKVLDEQRKNVHAFIRGTLAGWDTIPSCVNIPDTQFQAASYNPYKAGHFYDVATEAAVEEAQFAVLNAGGVWYA